MSSDAESLFAQCHALFQARRLPEAKAGLTRLLSSHPKHVPALQLLGLAHLSEGDADKAIRLIKKAVSIESRNGLLHFNLSHALKAAGRLDEAEAALEQALAQMPGRPEFLYALAQLRLDRGRLEAAAEGFRQAAEAAPQRLEPRLQQGIMLLMLEHPVEAEAVLRQANAIAPDSPEVFSNLGLALVDQERWTEAEACLRQAILLRPQQPQFHNNLGLALLESGQVEKALSCFDQALVLAPGFADAQSNRSLAFYRLGRLEDSIAAGHAAIALAPKDADAHYHLSYPLLALGRYEEGWREHEWRWRRQTSNQEGLRHTAKPLWQGGPPTGKDQTLLVWCEQGLGDSLQFARLLPLVAAQGWRVLFEVQPSLMPLFIGLPGVTCIPEGSTPPAFDRQCPLLGLPLRLNLPSSAIPAECPYVTCPPEKIAEWRQRLGSFPGRTIGLAWRGNPRQKRNRFRSIPVEALTPLTALPDLRFVSLQQDATADELALLRGGGASVIDAGPWLHDFTDTAAAMANCDLVISVCTSICHLAGALDKPVWTLLDFAADWRWIRGGSDSPWYPSMRLFWQSQPEVWTDVVSAVAEALKT